MTVVGVCFFVTIVVTITGTNAADKFNVLYAPDSLQFLGSKTTRESLLKEIICACLGLSIDESAMWRGLYVTDPFNTPEAVVEICLEGVSDVGSSTRYSTFPLTVDKNEPDVFEAVKRRIQQRYTSGGSKLLDVKLSDSKELTTQNFISVFGDIKLSNITELSLLHLNRSVKEDYQFLSELEILKAITAKVASGIIAPDNIVDFYNFRFGSLLPLINLHGMNSTQTKEAKELLDKALQELSKAFVRTYNGSVLVSTIVSDPTQTRRAVRSPNVNQNVRQFTEGPMGPQQNPTRPGVKSRRQEGDGDGNGNGNGDGTGNDDPGSGTGTGTENPEIGTGSNIESNEENEEFIIVFNIMLWFGLVYMFVLIAVVYATMAMDPGRDTVIYRMTTPRIKKDV